MCIALFCGGWDSRYPLFCRWGQEEWQGADEKGSGGGGGDLIGLYGLVEGFCVSLVCNLGCGFLCVLFRVPLITPLTHPRPK